MLYETFTVGQRSHDWGPRSPEHLLTPGELLAEFADWDVWQYEERDTPAAEASLLAREESRRDARSAADMIELCRLPSLLRRFLAWRGSSTPR